MTDKLTLGQVETMLLYCSPLNEQHYKVLCQLLDIMRENERLKTDLAQWGKIGELQLSINEVKREIKDLSYKHPDVTEARIRLADGDFLGKEESERIMGEILSKTPETK